MAAHESPRTTKLYDRTKDRLTQDEVERIRWLCQSNGRWVCAWRNTPTLRRHSSREGAPLGQCGRASLLVDLAGDEMALLIEMVVDLGVN